MNSDLISREALKKKLQARHDNGEEDFDKGYNIGIETAIELLDNVPTVENITVFCENADEKTIEELKAELKRVITELRPQGEWLKNTNEIYQCSLCGAYGNPNYFRFCPNCAAKMCKGGAE